MMHWTSLITIDEFLDLPDQANHEMELVEGKVKKVPLTRQSHQHGAVQMNLGSAFLGWRDINECKEITVSGGGACVLLHRDPDTSYGVDAVVSRRSQIHRTKSGATFVDGPPLLIVEILSASDRHDRVGCKIKAYLEAGVPMVWVADMVFSIITEHRPDHPPRSFNITQEITGDPHLPGFSMKVADIFVE